MNYLAHFLLAQRVGRTCNPESTNGLVMGALLGDFIKGPLKNQKTGAWKIRPEFPLYTLDGIKLHRYIDATFDSLEQIKRCRSLQEKSIRRYSGILADLAIDHLLALNWRTHSDETLERFEEQILHTLGSHISALPSRAKRLVTVFEQYRLLSRYTELSILEDTLSRICTRLPALDPREGIPALSKMTQDLAPHTSEIVSQMYDHCVSRFNESQQI